MVCHCVKWMWVVRNCGSERTLAACAESTVHRAAERRVASRATGAAINTRCPGNGALLVLGPRLRRWRACEPAWLSVADGARGCLPQKRSLHLPNAQRVSTRSSSIIFAQCSCGPRKYSQPPRRGAASAMNTAPAMENGVTNHDPQMQLRKRLDVAANSSSSAEPLATENGTPPGLKPSQAVSMSQEKAMAKRADLLHWRDMPQHLQFNPYIFTGYRPMLSIWGCINSLFYMHNETINIITHGTCNYFLKCFKYLLTKYEMRMG